MKKLNVPYLETLDVLSLSAAASLLQDKGRKGEIDSLNWTEYPYRPEVSFFIGRTNLRLYINYVVKGNSLKASYGKDGSPVYQDSCVEFFMQQEGEKIYRNFEFNCIGTCDASRRRSRTEKESLTPEEYAGIRRYSSIGDQPFEEKEGLYTWSLLVAIPFSTMDLDPGNLPEKIRANFYKCADETKYPHFLSWNPIDLPKPDFHCPPFFGELFL